MDNKFLRKVSQENGGEEKKNLFKIKSVTRTSMIKVHVSREERGDQDINNFQKRAS